MTKFAVTMVATPGNPHWRAFSEVAESVCIALRTLGHDCVMTHELDIPGRTHILFGAGPRQRAAISADAILYNMEPIHPEAITVDQGLLEMFHFHQVWDYSLVNVEVLRRLGVPRVRHVPVGHVPELERIPALPDEDIDVLFIGGCNHRRMMPLAALQILGVNAQTYFGVYGPERDLLYARAKIVLNLHSFSGQAFEVVRVSYLLMNGRFVVSETAAAVDTEGFERSVAFADYGRIVETCMHYLENPAERAVRARAGRAIMRARPTAGTLRDI